MTQAIRNFAITAATDTQVVLTLCAANTATLRLTAFPVFSRQTSDGTTFYVTDRPLRRFTPTTSVVTASTFTMTSNTATTSHSATLNFGTTFSASPAEHVDGGSPRRYRYVVHLSGHTPATAYVSAVTNNTAVVANGSIDIAIQPTAAAPAITVCGIAVS
jgi:hypothetical protein